MSETKIRWTQTELPDGTVTAGKTWNPVRGCSIVSPGCTNCYAMSIAERFSRPGLPFEGFAEKRNGHAVWTGRVDTLPHKLREPLTWRSPCRVFVNSMSDLFHERVPNEFLDQVFAVMEQCPQHTFQILTKRPERMQAYMLDYEARCNHDFWADLSLDAPCTQSSVASLVHVAELLPQVWLGVSVEDQRRADERIPLLLNTPAAVKFLSCEPLLGPVDLNRYLPALDWIIVGGESGPHYRPMNLDWARSLRDQCVAAGVPYFYKQSGGLRTETGQELDGVRWEEFPARVCQEVLL